MVKKLDVESILSKYPTRFESSPAYSPIGDCVHFFAENEDHYAERIDCWLTVYKSVNDHRLIGFKLKNIKALVSAFDKLGIEVRVSKNSWMIKILTLIAFVPWIHPESAHEPYYKDILSQFRSRSDETIELCPV